MKILQLIHKPQNRGAETFACQLSHHLTELGHEVKIIAVYAGQAQLPFLPEIETLNASAKKRVIDIRAWKKLSQIIKNFSPDIVQANSGDTLKYAVLSKFVFQWKTPLISRNASEVGRYLTSNSQKILNNFLYRQIDRVISVSHASKNDIVQHFPFLANKIQVIPVGLEKRTEITRVNLLPKGYKHIVHVGGFSFEKNHKGLLNIIEIILEKEQKIHLHLIGDGPLKPEIVKDVQNRGLSSVITFYGFLSDPLPYVNSANVLVLPSLIEGLPGVLLEAMYCKTPVVAYDVGGIAEVINENTGSIIAKGNELKFAAEVLKILKRNNDVQIHNAYENVNEHFLNEQLALKFVNSYEELILKKNNIYL